MVVEQIRVASVIHRQQDQRLTEMEPSPMALLPALEIA